MDTLKQHWNSIFINKSDAELGWYENDVSQTLKFLDLIPHETNTTSIFLPGAGTSVLAEIFYKKGYKQLILNDISDKALNRLKDRIPNSENIIWLNHDISKPVAIQTPQVDIWIDRAVLHFLLAEEEINGYFNNLKSLVKNGGYVLLAEFSLLGAAKCAGLDLHRYSVKEMSERLGSEFGLIKKEDYTYTNPSGGKRPYIYALFKKNIGKPVTKLDRPT